MASLQYRVSQENVEKLDMDEAIEQIFQKMILLNLQGDGWFSVNLTLMMLGLQNILWEENKNIKSHC